MWQASRRLGGSIVRDGLFSVLIGIWLFLLAAPFFQLAKVAEARTFLQYAAILLLIQWLLPLAPIRFIAALGTAGFFLHHFYYSKVPLFGTAWLKNVEFLFNSAVYSWLYLHQLNIDAVILTLFLLLLLWAGICLFRYAVKRLKGLLILWAMGLTAISIEDTFGTVDAHSYIMGYFIVGLLLLALSQVPQLEHSARLMRKRNGWPLPLWAGAAGVALCAAAVGIAVPKPSPQWPDPVGWIKSYSQNTSGKAVIKKIGYTSDDTHLGGSYVQDQTVVLMVVAPQKGYMRGEIRHVYTGKGWNTDQNANYIQGPSEQLKIVRKIAGINNPAVKSKQVQQVVTVMSGNQSVIFGQYQLGSVSIQGPARHQDALYNFNDLTAKSNLTVGYQYTVQSEVPYEDSELFNQQFKNNPHFGFGWSEEQIRLQAQRMPDASNLATNDPYLIAFFQPDLAIPSEFPLRDRQLAEHITAGLTTDYDKAKAIEQYLRDNYSYETQNIPVPGPQDDFVDQFLFETKKGYCDHFSSAMVMLARSVGLPARWVTGYAAGTNDPSFTDPAHPELNRYLIRNSDAHSWAEVFLRGVGWVPFEPTASFTMPKLYETKDTPVTAPAVPVPSPKKQEASDTTQADAGGSARGSHAADVWAVVGKTAAVLFGIGVLMIVVFRRKLMFMYYRTRPVKETGAGFITVLLLRMLTVFERTGMKFSQDMTLREYYHAYQNDLGKEWIPFIQIFEQVRYGNRTPDSGQLQRVRELFERMIRKLSRKNWR